MEFLSFGKTNRKEKEHMLKVLLLGININRKGNSTFISLQLRTKTMERMIPISILSKIDKYDIKIADKYPVRVDVLDSAELISSRTVNDLIPKLQKESPVVALDSHWMEWPPTNSLLVLCIDGYCLVVQLKHVDEIPDNLRRFLADEKICFVGVDVDRKLFRGMPSTLSPLVCKTAVELSLLAARIRKKPSLLNGDIEALAAEVGISYEAVASGSRRDPRVNYEAKVFSRDEVKALVLDAFFCYHIGRRLVEELLRDSSAPS
ncbi:hypothetical protein Nepgr_029908 [Nepenthes gracilis]|uniref:3'-5' exonuclease domain-containing protein n=1 Tax=Nepenthes gracilis TaxID=150966 RepID=A0AAD3Y5C5_NEPGR|nr:hypothetical protein Nepgr_029908 [Nepenthes gracilis]